MSRNNSRILAEQPLNFIHWKPTKIASFVYIFVHVVKELLINLEIFGRNGSPDRL
jgi:hypothetical protein